MTPPPAEIVLCPPELRVEALSLVLVDLAPAQRREIGGGLLRECEANDAAAGGLFVALRGDELCGAAWAQFQPGNTAVFWPPRLDLGETLDPTAPRLAAAALAALDAAGVTMTQVLLPAPDAPDAELLESVGFRYLTDLVYLTCEQHRFPAEAPSGDLRFEQYDESQRDRLIRIVERTYEETLDCPDLGGQRNMGDVLAGYRATGVYRPANWFFICAVDADRRQEEDVGALLLAEHPGSRHIELIYMGLAKSARGRGWGKQIVRQAQWIARVCGAERIVSAVDAANVPGMAVYRDAQFTEWDRRSVFLRFLKAS
jgi:ribosomal protein S18 acetylase RimI-like enzyme